MPSKPKQGKITSADYALVARPGTSFSIQTSTSGTGEALVTYDATPVVEWAVTPRIFKYSIARTKEGEKVSWSCLKE